MSPSLRPVLLAFAALTALVAPALAGSFVHQSPTLFHRVRSPCRDGQVMKHTGGVGARGAWSCAPK